MATAPTPGATASEVKFFRIRIQDRTLELSSSPTIKEKMAVRLATGLPFEAFYSGESSFGEDSLVVLWWLARRQNGEPNLTFDEVATSWPVLDENDLELTLVEPDEQGVEDSPEGSGPAS